MPRTTGSHQAPGPDKKKSSLRTCKPSLRTIVPGGSDGKASAYNAGDPGSIPGLGRSPGEGNGNPLQYSWLENPMDRGVHGIAKRRT